MTGPQFVSIGLSACLNGERVRYDGRDKFMPEIVNVLGSVAELTAYCPEVALGMSVPRPPIQLIGSSGGSRCVSTTKPHRDYTDSLQTLVNHNMQKWGQLSGYVFKSKSPSCGIGTTKIMEGGELKTDGTGIFSAAFKRAFPLMPVVQESELDNLDAIEHFLFRCLLYHYRPQWKVSSYRYDAAVEAILLDFIRVGGRVTPVEVHGLENALSSTTAIPRSAYLDVLPHITDYAFDSHMKQNLERARNFVVEALESSRAQCSVLMPLKILLASMTQKELLRIDADGQDSTLVC